MERLQIDTLCAISERARETAYVRGLPPGAAEASRWDTPSANHVQTYLLLRLRHWRVARLASLGFWVAQIGTGAAAALTPFLVLFSQYPTLIKVLPAGAAAVLAAFNGLTDWRGLATARADAVRSMDREFSRYFQRRNAYRDLPEPVADERFSNAIERINDVAERSRWLGTSPSSGTTDEPTRTSASA